MGWFDVPRFLLNSMVRHIPRLQAEEQIALVSAMQLAQADPKSRGARAAWAALREQAGIERPRRRRSTPEEIAAGLAGLPRIIEAV